MANEIAKRLKASMDPALLWWRPSTEKPSAAMSLKQAEQQTYELRYRVKR